MAGCHLRGRRHSSAVRFPVIWQLQVRGQIAGAISEQRLAAGAGNTRASARRPGRCTGLERSLDSVGDELGSLGVDGDVAAEQQPAVRYQHDLHKARCACGRVHAAPRPAGVPDAPPVRRPWPFTCRALPARPGGAGAGTDLRPGRRRAVSRVHPFLPAKAVGLAAEPVRLIRMLIAAAPVVGFDETTLRSSLSSGG